MEQAYAIEMLHITKRFPGIVANDDITLQLKKGEIHALINDISTGIDSNDPCYLNISNLYTICSNATFHGMFKS